MADFLNTAVNWLSDRMVANASQTVTYRRAAASVSISATLGSSMLRINDAAGRSRVERTDRDFIVRSADLILSGSATTPARGDHIDLTIGGTIYRYDVMSPVGEPPWRYSDSHNKMMRIHTKYIGTV